MGRRQARWAIAAAVFVSGCIPRTYPTATPPAPSAETDVAAEEAVLFDHLVAHDHPPLGLDIRPDDRPGSAHQTFRHSLARRLWVWR